MNAEQKLAQLEAKGWDVKSLNFADLIISRAFEDELSKLLDVLLRAKFDIGESIIKRGGGLADQTKKLSGEFDKIGTKNKISVVNHIEFERDLQSRSSNSTSHEIDHLIKNRQGELLAVEVEWNNKDEFYDRDFQSIKRLYELGVIEAGIIVTRGESLEDELLPMIRKYFEDFPIEDFADFEKLKLQFPNTKEAGKYLFSFPTENHASDIRKKVNNNMRFAAASAEVFKDSKFAGTTTNWGQLKKRIERRDAGRTPVLCLGIPESVFE
ncbi:BglII/BstYI family type II restriction endonuclease [Ruegeria arenilitoris]|uniref:BglII/BstYI family type II restriction endonuclease n=1 Tax=Ruegeria arenilitoris TaxID=1173585 RepID=UPI003C79E791